MFVSCFPAFKLRATSRASGSLRQLSLQVYPRAPGGQERERNLHVMTRNLNYDVSMGEYLCAICDRLSNTVLPVVPSLSSLRRKQSASGTVVEIGRQRNDSLKLTAP